MRLGAKGGRGSLQWRGTTGVLCAALWSPANDLSALAQARAGVDLYSGLLCVVVCFGLLLTALLIVAFVRSGRRPRPSAVQEEPAPAEPSTCPECGRLITRPGERFCIQCGTRLPD